MSDDHIARMERARRLQAYEEDTHARPDARIDLALAGLGLIFLSLLVTGGIVVFSVMTWLSR